MRQGAITMPAVTQRAHPARCGAVRRAHHVCRQSGLVLRRRRLMPDAYIGSIYATAGSGGGADGAQGGATVRRSTPQ